jgi:DNA-directed RNA polymerase alpha subunit
MVPSSVARLLERLHSVEGPGDKPMSAAGVNFLKAENIYLVGDLIQHTETELLRTPKLGRNTVGRSDRQAMR